MVFGLQPGTHVFFLALAVAVAGCEDGDPILYVELRTDIPQSEFRGILVEARSSDSGPVYSSEIDRSEETDYTQSTRVAALELPSDIYRVRVMLQSNTPGSVLVERSIMTVVREARVGVRVDITRDCPNVACEDGETCVGGTCVSQNCSGDNLDQCEPECTFDDDCADPPASCAASICLRRKVTVTQMAWPS